MPHETKIANLFVEHVFNKQPNELCVTHGTYDGEHVDINLTDIVDVLMEAVGRYCDRNRNDFLITWNSVQNLLEKATVGNNYVAFAIRRLGVDSNLFMYSRINDHKHKHQPGWIDAYYRKIFILKINRSLETGIFGQTPDDIMALTITLKDVTDSISTNDINTCKSTTHSAVIHSMDTDNDIHYEKLKSAYTAYENNTPFMPDTIAALESMHHNIRIHNIAPNIHTIESLIATMENHRTNEDDWHNTSAEDWTKYCHQQIGLIAAILRIKQEGK